jgi:hypothetical protein
VPGYVLATVNNRLLHPGFALHETVSAWEYFPNLVCALFS